jgi:hypothetical protein
MEFEAVSRLKERCKQPNGMLGIARCESSSNNAASDSDSDARRELKLKQSRDKHGDLLRKKVYWHLQGLKLTKLEILSFLVLFTRFSEPILGPLHNLHTVSQQHFSSNIQPWCVCPHLPPY